MRVRSVVSVAVILLMCSQLVSAQDTGWYVGAGGGSADVDVSGFDDASSAKVFGGYHLTRHLGFEGGFVDLGEFDFDPVPGTSVEVDGIQIVAIARLPLGEKVSLFGKGGLYAWEADATILGVSIPIEDDDGTDSTFGFGVEFLPGKWGVRGEWERFDIDGDDVDLISVSFVYSPRKPAARARELEAPAPKPEPTEATMPAPEPAPAVPATPAPAIPEVTAAEQGDINAQYRLGYMYSVGQGVPKDDAEAVRWYRSAAEQGHARAQYNLGAAYANGRGVALNRETAVDWLFKAGQSFLREGKQDLALRVVDAIERLVPGHRLAGELLAAIRAKFGQ